MAEARLSPMEERSWTLAARLLGRALGLPSGDPLAPARDRRGLGTGAPAFGPRLEIARPPGLGESENPTVATDGWRHLPVGRVPDPGWGHGGGKGKRGYAAPRVPAPVCCPALDGRICGGRSLQVLGGSRAGLAVFVFVFVFTFKSDPHTKCVAITAQNPYPRLLI